MSALKLCVICGEPTPESRCIDHRPEQPNKTSRHERGYGNAWSRLSAKARKLQPWCDDCGTKEDLTADHLVWPALRLEHVAVVCRSCNSIRGETPRDGSPRSPQRPSNGLDTLHASQYQDDSKSTPMDRTETARAIGADRRTKDPRGMAFLSTQSDTEYAFRGPEHG